MSIAFETVMDRQPALQTITWLLNLKKFDQLDLDPPYQRKSVWSLREKQRFLDTILRNYPSPALFLHVTYDDEGNVTYHVVDGKQRISTILDFVDGKIRLAKDTGDNRLDGAKWSDLAQFPGIRKNFWTYQVTVEQIDDIQEPLVREIFERLNRNSRKLEAQELRHAQFDGWLISYLEEEAERPIWKELKVSSRAKARRMSDVQQLSEFAQVIYERSVVGFDQDALTRMYSDLEDPEETIPDFDRDTFKSDFESAAQYMLAMERANSCITTYATSRTNVYPLWCWIVLNKPDAAAANEIAAKYAKFMDLFLEARQATQADSPDSTPAAYDENVRLYLHNFTGASTEAPQREKRYAALSAALSS
jgi:hypothetical protein